VLIDPATLVTLPLARLRRKLGINQFSEFNPNGEPDADYNEPLTGVKEIKQVLAAYIMKLVVFTHSPDNVPLIVKRQSVGSLLVETARQRLIVI